MDCTKPTLSSSFLSPSLKQQTLTSLRFCSNTNITLLFPLTNLAMANLHPPQLNASAPLLFVGKKRLLSSSTNLFQPFFLLFLSQPTSVNFIYMAFYSQENRKHPTAIQGVARTREKPRIASAVTVDKCWSGSCLWLYVWCHMHAGARGTDMACGSSMGMLTNQCV